MNTTSPATHLIEFTAENYRSIREPVTLSMFSTPRHDKTADFSISTAKRKLLSSAVLYGANASGKSNLLHALFIYRQTVVGVNDLFAEDRESAEPFLLDDSSRTAPTTFEASFEYNDRMYIYGFQVSSKDSCISGEWLKATKPKSSRMVAIYNRRDNKVDINKGMALSEHGISRTFTKQLQSQELFITTLSKNSSWTIARNVVEAWNNCHVLNTLYHNPLESVARSLYDQPARKTDILNLLQRADITIRDIRVKRNDGGDYEISLEHSYSTNKSIKSVWFDIKDQESVGTLKFFAFAQPLLMSLRSGSLMVLDELGSTLHPDLLRFIIRMFNDPKTNSHHAQLIVTTHDTSLMRDMFARDQIYFTAKTQDQTTELYALSDIRGVRKDLKNLDERYLNGDFGAVPELIEG